MEKLTRTFNQFFCSHGTAMLLFGDKSLKLRCPDCGHETEGWDWI